MRLYPFAASFQELIMAGANDTKIVVTYLVTLKSRRPDKLTRIIFDSWAVVLNLMLCIPKIVWLMEDPENAMIGCTLSGWYKYCTCSMIMVRPDCGPMNNFLGPLMCKCHNSFGRQPNLILMELMGWLLKCSSWLTAWKLNYETNWPVIPYHWTGPLDGSPVANNLRCRTSSSTKGHFTVAHEKWLHR